jgi:hypothetical protein
MDEFRYVGPTPTELEGGRPIEPGEFTGAIDVSDEAPANKTLFDEGRLIRVPTSQEREKAEADAKKKEEDEAAAADLSGTTDDASGKKGKGESS